MSESQWLTVADGGGHDAEGTTTPTSESGGSQVMAFTRTLRHKLRSAGFRPMSQSNGSNGNASGEGGVAKRQVSETPSTSSRAVTIVQNIYVYVSGSGGPTTATVLHRPLRLRKQLPKDEAFIDDENPKYQACCHKCHVTRSAFIIGLVELIFAAMYLVEAIRHVAVTGKIVASLMELTFAVVFVVAVVLLIIGVRTERKSLLMPHLVWSIMFVVIGAAIIIVIFVSWFLAASTLAWTLATVESKVQDKFDVIEAKTRVAGVNGSAPAQSEFNTGESDRDDDYFAMPDSLNSAAKGKLRTRRTADTDNEDDDQARKTSAALKSALWAIVVLLVGMLLVSVGLEVWAFLIIRACYHYLEDKEAFLRGMDLDDAGVASLKPLPTLVEKDEDAL